MVVHFLYSSTAKKLSTWNLVYPFEFTPPLNYIKGNNKYHIVICVHFGTYL